MENIFCYGTLENKSVEHKVLGRFAEEVKDSLAEYTTEHINIDGESFLRAIPSANEELSGKRFVCSEHELQKMDEYEGKDYARVKNTLRSGIVAWVYVRPE